MGRPRTNDTAVRERLVACATEMFATRPQESVTVRALATAAGTSTAAVYTLFHGKDGLVREVRDQAVAGLFQHLTAVPRSENALKDLDALAAAYRHWGREHRHLYTVLFGGAQSFVPSTRVGDHDPVRPLVAAIDRAVADHLLAGDTTQIAVSLWVALHGLVTLELTSSLDNTAATTAFRSTVDAILRGWAPPTPSRSPRRTHPTP
ncbi:TetR/AcrR family transcriptional regulator [Streptomyces sp. NPDC059161]|uniref:TetR/AcrR family transcriptional regulator n=1 Tax=unclassified Streptomyces TaxID=2593676 RepID=UPI00364684D1